jgi:hypothetical protein
MYLAKLSFAALCSIACAFSFGSDNSHVCVSSDGSFITFGQSPARVPMRMYVSESCIYGDITDHHVRLYIKLRNPSDDSVLFNGHLSFVYYQELELWARIKTRADEIMNSGIWEETSGRYAKYKIEADNPNKIAYISSSSDGVSLFECSLYTCEFEAKVDGSSMFYRSYGRYARGFDPAVAEDVIKDFIAQLFKIY